jgi:hypothetical protein
MGLSRLKSTLDISVSRIRNWRPGQRHEMVLCRPRGGLNDSLVQMDACRVYAAKFGRTLWIDGRRSGFHDCFSRYFTGTGKIHFGCPDSQLDYQPSYDPSIGNWVDAQSGRRLTFDMSKRHDEAILLHEQCGGGKRSLEMFRHLQFQPEVRTRISGTIERLGRYDAIHVRNTDLTTDYVALFNTLSGKVGPKVVVCTDDFECFEFAREFWGERLAVVRSLEDNHGESLHRHARPNQYQTNMNVLMDLFILASAQRYYFGQVAGKVGTSGFSRLATLLRKNPRLVRRLLSGR